MPLHFSAVRPSLGESARPSGAIIQPTYYYIEKESAGPRVTERVSERESVEKTAAKLCDLDVIQFLFLPLAGLAHSLLSLSAEAPRGVRATFDARYLAHRKHFEERSLRRHAKPPPFPSPLCSPCTIF